MQLDMAADCFEQRVAHVRSPSRRIVGRGQEPGMPLLEDQAKTIQVQARLTGPLGAACGPRMFHHRSALT